MPVYTYTVDLPYTTAVQNKRAFIKLPKSILLAPYLAINQYFVDYANAIDTVFDYWVEAKIDALCNIRNMWVSTKAVEQKIKDGQMIAFTDWGGPERAIIVSQTNLLGMKLANAGAISESSYRAIAKFIGSYWFGKGKNSAVDFLSFCLGSGLTISKMWTTDYVKFYIEGSSFIGTPIWQGGPWYPTTHVQIGMPGDYPIDAATIGAFFYEICNYNLVLQSIAISFNAQIVTNDSDTLAICVATVGVGYYVFNGQTPYYPMGYHSVVGGWSGGVGRTLQQLDTTPQ